MSHTHCNNIMDSPEFKNGFDKIANQMRNKTEIIGFWVPFELKDKFVFCKALKKSS